MISVSNTTWGHTDGHINTFVAYMNGLTGLLQNLVQKMCCGLFVDPKITFGCAMEFSKSAEFCVFEVCKASKLA